MSEIPQVLSVLLLDAEGKRVAVKYWDEDMTTVTQQMAHERSVFAKTSRNNARGDAEIAALAPLRPATAIVSAEMRLLSVTAGIPDPARLAADLANAIAPPP